MTDVVEALLKARALIEKPENWIQNQFSRGDSFCALEALNKVLGPREAALHTFGAFHILRNVLPKPFLSIVEFNDWPTTHHEDVLALFDTAIFLALEPKE